MNIVYTVRSDSPRAATRAVDRSALGLDIWQVKADHVVLRAAEEQATRLRRAIRPKRLSKPDPLARFATAEAIAAIIRQKR